MKAIKLGDFITFNHSVSHDDDDTVLTFFNLFGTVTDIIACDTVKVENVVTQGLAPISYEMEVSTGDILKVQTTYLITRKDKNK